jgi:putative NADPH-quinone reductase
VRVLVVYAHPDPDSFVGRLKDTVVGTLARCGHQVDLLDLYAEGFDPVLRDTSEEDAEHARRLVAADALVLVHPTWWSGQPAILKGWVDRVWAEGVAYHVRPGSPRPRRLLRGLRRLVVVTTHGSSRRVNLVQGESGRRLVLRSLRALAHPLVRCRWVAYYGIDEDLPARREVFVARVAREMARL